MWSPQSSGVSNSTMLISCRIAASLTFWVWSYKHSFNNGSIVSTQHLYPLSPGQTIMKFAKEYSWSTRAIWTLKLFRFSNGKFGTMQSIARSLPSYWAIQVKFTVKSMTSFVLEVMMKFLTLLYATIALWSSCYSSSFTASRIVFPNLYSSSSICFISYAF